jgi:hypothetical protein
MSSRSQGSASDAHRRCSKSAMSSLSDPYGVEASRGGFRRPRRRRARVSTATRCAVVGSTWEPPSERFIWQHSLVRHHQTTVYVNATAGRVVVIKGGRDLDAGALGLRGQASPWPCRALEAQSGLIYGHHRGRLEKACSECRRTFCTNQVVDDDGFSARLACRDMLSTCRPLSASSGDRERRQERCVRRVFTMKTQTPPMKR